MALKKKQTNPATQNRMEELLRKKNDLLVQINNIRDEVTKIDIEMAEIKLSPFKVGDTVQCEVTSGRTKKMQKCVIEVEDVQVFVRPYTASGELSGRHFYVHLNSSQTYADVFKKV